MSIVAIGTSRFLLGFSLAGIAKTILSSAGTVMQDIKKASNAAIVILDEELTSNLSTLERAEIGHSTSPVILILGKHGEAEMQRLKSEAKNTLGVDIL